MPEVRTIGISAPAIPELRVWMTPGSTVIPEAPPVTLQLGVPIVQVPGCVEANQDNSKSGTLIIDDPRSAQTYCDGTMPSFDPLDYRAQDLIFTPKAGLPSAGSPEKPLPPPSITLPPIKPVTKEDKDLRCPPLRAKEIGTLVQDGRKKISGYKIKEDKCVTIYEEVPLGSQVIAAVPTLPQVTKTGSIAFIATSMAIATPFLIKLVKPTVKKVMKKIQKILSKKTKVLSVSERQKAQRASRK
tara:strand:+ start:1711 stop:2439 length:729 start_codon:yes stop_codon:yes gene_type:complete